jgi:hypothetical protein
MYIKIPDEIYENVQKLIKDYGAKNAPQTDDIDKLIDNKSNEYIEYWGEQVTLHKNWQSSPDHPETFLAYITVAEAKLLRSLGLGYSNIDGKYQQHYDNQGIPSFNGYGIGDSDEGSFSTGGNTEGEAEASNNGGGDSGDEDGNYLDSISVVDDAVANLHDDESMQLNEDLSYDITSDDYSYSVNPYGEVTEAIGKSQNENGGYTVNSYSVGFFGATNESYQTDKYGSIVSHETSLFNGLINYDTHYYSENNKQFGTLAELYADTSEVLGFNINENIALGIDIVEDIAQLYYSMKTFETALSIGKYGSSIGNTGLSFTGYYGALESLNTTVDTLQDMSITIGYDGIDMSSIESGEGEPPSPITTEEEYKKYIEGLKYDISNITDIDVQYEWMAGGELYNANAGSFGYLVSTVNEPNRKILGINTKEDRLYDQISLAKQYIKYT